MFHNENVHHYIHRNKFKKSKIKKSSLQNNDSSNEHLKSNKFSKVYKKNKHSKFKHVNAVSDYVGPERLTNHVGFFTKGKISDSISRLEKIMPKEVRARAKQDLREVLELTNNDKRNHLKKSRQRKKCNKISKNISREQNVQHSFITPQYLYHKTGFASSVWKDKLIKSVGLKSVNSILASVQEVSQKVSPIEGELLIARKALLTKIHPSIKEGNISMFPAVSNRDRLKSKLQQIKRQLVPAVNIKQASACSSICDSATTSNKNSQNSLNKDFELNPIFTGDSDPIEHRDITKIFPPAKNFVDYSDDSMTDIDSNYFSSDIIHNKFEKISSQATSSNIGIGNGSVTFIPSSPTTSNDSPAWKLRMSPILFVPEKAPTPTFYFRHKMF